MNSLAIHDQSETRGQGRSPRCGMGHSRASAIDHHQTSADNSSRPHHLGRAIVPGRFFASTGEILEFTALTRAGLRAEVALANLNPQIGHHVCQDLADLPECHSSVSVRYAPTRSETEAQKIGKAHQQEAS